MYKDKYKGCLFNLRFQAVPKMSNTIYVQMISAH